LARQKRLLSYLTLTLFWLSTAYFCVAPLLRPRGLFGWGYYRLVDIYIGLPSLLFAICTTLFVFASGTRLRKFALKLTTIAASVLITIGVADLAYAFIVQGAWESAHTDVWFDGVSITDKDDLPDDELGFARKAGVLWQGRLAPEARLVTYRTDQNGFRNPNGITKADVVFIGDSFTEAGSVNEEETFVQKFGSQSKLSVINLGRGFYGPPQELIVLKRYGFRYNPRLVVWQIFEGNDLTDANRFSRWTANPAQRDSLALRYTKRSLIARMLMMTIPKESGAARLFDDREGKTHRLFLDYSYIPDEPAREPLGMAETKKAIEEGQRLCASRSVKLLIVFVPIKVRVIAPYVHFLDAADREHYLPGGKLDSDADFSSELARFCKQLGCPFLDVTDALRKRAAEDNRYVYSTNQDSHLDVDGHSVVADVLEEWRQTNMLPKSSLPLTSAINK